MLFKFEKLILIVVCCQLCFVSCDPVKKIDRHTQSVESPNIELNDQPNPTESDITDSIRLALDKKRERLRNMVLKQKQPSKSDKLKLYSIDGDWKLTKSHWLSIVKFPVFGIDTAAMALYGGDGCNTIYGDILIYENNRIEISRIGGTKMHCLNIKRSDQYFRESLKEARTFKIKGLNLFLFNEDKELLLEFERILWKE